MMLTGLVVGAVEGERRAVVRVEAARVERRPRAVRLHEARVRELRVAGERHRQVPLLALDRVHAHLHTDRHELAIKLAFP